MTEPKTPHSVAARRLMRHARSAMLATALAEGARGEAGWPYGSLVTVALDCDASPILLFSDLSDHTRNIKADSRASLLFEAASRRANPQTGPRVTAMGRVEPTADERLKRRFLARHPEAEMYAAFKDFRFHRMTVERAHFVGGFARAVWIDGERMRFDADIAGAIAEMSEGVVEHMNGDHAEAVNLYANRLLDRKGTGWIMTGIDPEGIDLRLGRQFARLDFEAPLAGADAVRAELVRLAGFARSRK